MKEILPNALFIGFTGTPLLKTDKQKSIEVFGRYIHTYKFDQAVREGVVLDLRYEARDIDQQLTSKDKIDQWFEAKTKGLNDLAKAQLKQKWGTMQRVLSSQSRLAWIADDILIDMATRPRLMDGHGNAMLVAGSIYEACKFYELLARTELMGKCAIVTSYAPTVADAKGETTGDGDTDKLLKYGVYCQMLADWFNEPQETAIKKVEKFEQEVKKKFISEPGQMKLLIVVDKLLTGFDAPSATYLYIDKEMRDHGLFQAICRVNRVERGPDAVNSLPKGIKNNEEAVAETIENNVRKLIINESPVDPAYYEKMSKLLDALIEQRRKGAISYKAYLAKIAALTKEASTPGGGPGGYPAGLDTSAKRTLYNNLSKDETLALAIDAAVHVSRMDGWRGNTMKTKRVRLAIKAVLEQAYNDESVIDFAGIKDGKGDYNVEAETTRILELVKNQNDY